MVVVELPDHRLIAIQAVDSADEDSLIDDLLQSNAEFQALVAKSKSSPRRLFRAGSAK